MRAWNLKKEMGDVPSNIHPSDLPKDKAKLQERYAEGEKLERYLKAKGNKIGKEQSAYWNKVAAGEATPPKHMKKLKEDTAKYKKEQKKAKAKKK